MARVTSARWFRGWNVVAAGTVATMLQGGFIFWSMGLYTAAFEDHFGAPRAQINLIETFLTVGVNLMSPFLGLWVDKRSARHLVAVGALALGGGMILISLAGTLVHIWVVYATLIPLGALALGVLPVAGIIARWFRRRRGLALGIAVTGTSIGGALFPPVITWLFSHFDWRIGLQVCGVFVIVLAPLVLKGLVNFPEDVGLEPESEDPGAKQKLGDADRVDWAIRDILRSPPFWVQTLIAGSLLAITLGMLANLSLHAKDLGITGQKKRRCCIPSSPFVPSWEKSPSAHWSIASG